MQKETKFEIMKSQSENNIDKEVEMYYKILSEDFPMWLKDYINVPELQRLKRNKYAMWYRLFKDF